MRKYETQKEKLIELLSEYHRGNHEEAERIADQLIENGVIIFPCKVGDAVYVLSDDEVSEQIVVKIDHDYLECHLFTKCKSSDFCRDANPCIKPVEICSGCYSEREIGRTIFLTRESAEFESLRKRLFRRN